MIRDLLKIPVLPIAVALAALGTGCSSPSKSSCVPGQSVACIGVGGCPGGQVCNADGHSFSTCACAQTSSGGSGGSSSGAATTGGQTGATTASSTSGGSVSQIVGPEGGTVSTPGGTQIQIPADALSQNTTVTVTADPGVSPPAGLSWVGTPYIFGPEGTQFALPVTVVLAFASSSLPTGSNASQIIIETAPVGSTNYTSLGGSLADANHVRATTTHFSTFGPAIAEGSASTTGGTGGTGTTGGTGGTGAACVSLDFSDQATLGSGTDPYGMVVGDFNGDGIPDLAIANTVSYSVSVLLGQGGGRFAPQKQYPTSDDSPWSIAVGDFNGDGNLDLVVANSHDVAGNPGNIGILFGDGDGGFGAQVSYSMGKGIYPSGLAVGDFNHDGVPDVAFTTSVNGGTDAGIVSILTGHKDGGFGRWVSYVVGGIEPQAVAVGDLNNDGNPDLVVTNTFQTDKTVSVLLADGDGGFAPQVPYAVGEQPASISIADFNGDGFLDLAVLNSFSTDVPSTLSILLGKGDGSFSAQLTYSTVPEASGLAVADLNGDGILDVAMTNGFLLGYGDGGFAPPVAFDAGGPGFVASGYFQGGSVPDLVVTNEPNAYVTVLYNSCAGAGPSSSSGTTGGSGGSTGGTSSGGTSGSIANYDGGALTGGPLWCLAAAGPTETVVGTGFMTIGTDGGMCGGSVNNVSATVSVTVQLTDGCPGEFYSSSGSIVLANDAGWSLTYELDTCPSGPNGTSTASALLLVGCDGTLARTASPNNSSLLTTSDTFTVDFADSTTEFLVSTSGESHGASFVVQGSFSIPLGGACASPLQSPCSDGCTDLTTLTDCGACGVACGSGDTCASSWYCTNSMASQQAPAAMCCPSGSVLCNSACADLSSDVGNCGACGTVCDYDGLGQVCQNGTCACPLDAGICDSVCDDFQTDPSNCGLCHFACQPGQSCSGGQCLN